MFRKKRKGWTVSFLLLSDILASTFAFVLSYLTRFHTGLIKVNKPYDYKDYIHILPFALVIWIFGYAFVNLYRKNERIFNFDVIVRILKGCVIGIILLTSASSFYREQEYSRLVLIFTPFYALVFTSTFRYILNEIIAKSQEKGIGVSNAIIVGTGITASNLAKKIMSLDSNGINLFGFISFDKNEVGKEIESLKVIGNNENISEIIKQFEIKEVFIADADLKHEDLLKIMFECEKEIVDFRVVPDFIEMMFTDVSVEVVDGMPFIGLKESPLRGINLLYKRIFDIIGSLIGLILLLPFIPIITFLIRRESKGEAIFKQERLGIDGKRFTIYKFRTMIPNAEDKTGPVWAEKQDPRLTKIGAFLRKYNIDELPQFYNVFIGDMSLVGPRPERPYFVEQFREALPRYMSRHRVKSGMTGWAQINGLRQNTSITERLKFDLYYVENWSLWLDIKILLLSIVTKKTIID